MIDDTRRHSAWFLGAALGVLLILTAASPASGQFGQNKVQYDDFDFQVIETSRFDIYYYPSEADAARQVARMAERWHGRLGGLLGHQLTGRQAVVLYASHPEFEQTNVVSGMIDESTGGITEGLQRRVVMPLAASLGETDHVLGHEIVHAFQYDILGRRAGAVPLWFIEGMAEYLSVGPQDPHTAMWLRDAALEDRLPTIRDLSNPAYFPYRFGHAFWAYIGGRWGDAMVGRILAGVAGGDEGIGGPDPIRVIEDATELDSESLSEQWHQSIRELYGIEPRSEEERPERTASGEPADGRVIIGAESGSGSLNVGPALSPDGSKVAFLSARGRLSIDLYVADTSTGDVLHRLTRTAVDPHFQSLQFLQSAGTWSPDSRSLAVATVQAGRAAIVVFDVDSGTVSDEIRLDARGEAFQPSWSPNGGHLMYAAQIGGLTDLYVYDFETRISRQVTSDAFADLQPSWSPDGERVVFVTDRFTSDLEALDFGPYRLASLDLATGTVNPIETGLSGDAVNPQWSADGSALYFISNHTGRPDVYRTDVTTSAPGRTTRVTSVATGVSGITPLSPALSLALGSDRVALTLFRDSGYEIHVHNVGGEAEAGAVPPGRTDDLAVLPPENREASLVAAALERPDAGLPPSSEDLPSRAYSPSLALAAVGSSVGGARSSTFGTYVSGGVAFLFSDLLGNHTVSIGADVNGGGARDFSGQAAYINRDNRWNWGVFTEHVPLLSGTVRASTGVVNGQAVYVETTDLDRQTYTTLGAMVAYPFSRALRLELSASGQRIGFSRERRQLVFDAFTGDLLLRDNENLGGEPALALAQASAALVRDTSAFGATGPILGQRFRLEVTPTAGDLSFTSATTDVRQYAMPVTPLTLAGRLLHIGRYGGGSEDQRLLPLFLGYPTLVRGYDVNSFEANECVPTVTGSCPAFDRLIGSRIAVINAEARMPLFGFGGNISYGPIPTELFAFFDAGVAWTRDLDPAFGSSGDREWVKSLGVGARVNVFGYAVAEFNLARPLDRPGREDDWLFVFNLRQGF